MIGLISLISIIVLFPHTLFPLIILYLLIRNICIPIVKSNYINVFKYISYRFDVLIFTSLIIDISKVIGIILGIIKRKINPLSKIKMKILILGSNGHLGKYFVDLLKSQKNLVIFTVSSSNSLEHRKNHSAIDLNKDIKKLYNLIIKNNFNLIINCLLIKNIHNKFDTVIPKKIVNFYQEKNLNQLYG